MAVGNYDGKRLAGRPPSGEDDLLGGPSELILPSGEAFEDWLERALAREREAKTRSGFHISEGHGFKAEEIRRYLIQERGVSRGDAPLSSVVEWSLDLLHEIVFSGEPER